MSDSSARAAPFATLLAVQDLDTAINQHEHRKATLPERHQLEEITARRTAVRRQAAQLGTERDEFGARLGRLEEQTAAVLARRKLLEDRLYSARGASGRDLAAIEAEVAQLAARLSQLENEELALMEVQEPVDAALATASREIEELTERARELAALVAQADGTLDAELALLYENRRVQAEGLPEQLALRYEQLRSRLGGIGAARLVGNRCDGCHLTLPSVEMDRIRHLPEDELITCEQCGRILVRVLPAS